MVDKSNSKAQCTIILTYYFYMPILKIIIFQILRNFPFKLGMKLRSISLYFLMNSRDINIDTNCIFVNIKNIKFSSNINIGINAYLNADGGSIFIGNGTSIGNEVSLNSAITGKIEIGQNCLIANRVSMRSANHVYADKNKLIKLQGHIGDDIVIGNDVWIGMGALILPGAKIGTGAVIGAGAVVSGVIPEYSVAVGVPARVICFRL